jgi:hypothetical protein
MTHTTDHLATMGDEDEAGAPASAEHVRGGQCPDHPAAPRQASAESAIAAPLVAYGTDPGYSIPDPVAMQGMPRGAVWTTASTGSVPQCSARWAEVQRLCSTCFGPLDSYHSIDYADTDDTCKQILGVVPGIIRAYPQQCAFGGCRVASYPWQLSTDTSQGPTTIEYTISHSIEKSESVTEGWAVGGTAGFTLGPFGGSVSKEYSESRTNTTSWSKAGSTSSTANVPAGDWGRIDVFATAGLYDGYLYFSIKEFLGHPGGPSGNHCFQIDNHHYWTTHNYLCFPLRAIMVKSPDSPSPLIRVPRTWANGTPAPPTTMSGGTRSDAVHDHGA